MSRKKVAIIGTVGIPAKYGGFETLVEYLTKQLNFQFSFTIFCSSKSYKTKLTTYNNSKLEYVSLNANGIQSILYDIISLFKASKKSDIILILGVSGAIILPLYRLFYPKKKLIINIDGLEHQREKWNSFAKKFLKFSEKLAIKYGDEIITDNEEIKKYVKKEYNKDSNMIAYGADHVEKIPLSTQVKEKYKLPDGYAFKVCRIEPENNIHVILEAFKETELDLVIIGNWNKSDYGIHLLKEYNTYKNIHLLQPIYNQNVLNQIRSNCKVYIHGHSAGGTNPSLVEAMALELPIIAYGVNYNKATTHNKAIYFNDKHSLKYIISRLDKNSLYDIAKNMKVLAQEHYTWQSISSQYSKLFLKT